MLAELLKLKEISIAISGTHGKTTTCSMLGSILFEAKLNPTLVIGGIVNNFASNVISGKGNIIVVEADEFDRSFLSLKPNMGIINNDSGLNKLTDKYNDYNGKISIELRGSSSQDLFPKKSYSLETKTIDGLQSFIMYS